MERVLAGVALFAVAAAVFAHGHPVAVDDQHPEAKRIRTCERMADVALQALHDRDKGKPMKLFQEDGAEARLANEIIRHVFEEPQIRSPKFAEAYGRGRCNEQLTPR